MSKKSEPIPIEAKLTLDFLARFTLDGVHEFWENSDHGPGWICHYNKLKNTSGREQVNHYAIIKETAIKRGWLISSGQNCSITPRGIEDAALFKKNEYREPPQEIKETALDKLKKSLTNHPVLAAIVIVIVTLNCLVSFANGLIQLIDRLTVKSDTSRTGNSSHFTTPRPIEELRPPWLRK